jgi:Effector-associated domain 11
MIQPHEAPRRALEIRKLVATNDVPGAVNRLMDFINEFSTREHLDEVTVLSMRLSSLDEDMRRRMIERQAAQDERARLMLDMLALMRSVEDRLLREVGHA